MDNIGPDEDDDFTDIREQIFHNTVREQIVSIVNGVNGNEKVCQIKINSNFGIKREKIITISQCRCIDHN